MTSRALGFALLTLVAYLAANQTRVGWLYVIAAWMVAVLLLSLILPWLWTRNIMAQRSVRSNERSSTAAVMEGDRVEVRLTLSTRGLPCHLIRVTDHCPLEAPDAQRKVYFHLRIGREGATTVYDVQCYKRGRYTFPPPEVESRGPFGFFRRRRQVGAPLPVQVYPWYLQRPGTLAAPRALQIQEPTGSTGVSSEVLGTREYRPGDPLRYVHWRSTARRDRLVVKEFEQQRDRALAMILDITHEYGSGKETTLEYSVKIAASIARYALDRGLPFRLVAQGAPRGMATWPQVLEFLTDVRADPDATPLERLLPQAGVSQDVIVASAAPAGSMASQLGRLKGGSRYLVINFTGFEDVGYPPLEQAAPSVSYVPWRQGESPEDAIARILGALETGTRPDARP